MAEEGNQTYIISKVTAHSPLKRMETSVPGHPFTISPAFEVGKLQAPVDEAGSTWAKAAANRCENDAFDEGLLPKYIWG